MFRIRHKPTGKFIKKCAGSMGFTFHLIIENDIDMFTTSGLGHSYNTRRGAESFLDRLPEPVRNNFEIVPFVEV